MSTAKLNYETNVGATELMRMCGQTEQQENVRSEDLPEWMSSRNEIRKMLTKCYSAANDIGLEMLGIDSILTDLFLVVDLEICERLFSIWRNVKESREIIQDRLDDIRNLMGICPMGTRRT